MKSLIQSRLLRLAALFLFLYALALSFAPTIRNAPPVWGHWTGIAVWSAAFLLLHRETTRHLPEADPYLLPTAALLSGWGLLSVWRLAPNLGIRQTLWMGVSTLVFLAALKGPDILDILRRYKYLWLSGGLFLVALTLVFGQNPLGGGPRLWLGCCSVYFQPSEPLKLLLLIYLAAYLSEKNPFREKFFPLLFPTITAAGMAVLLIFVQRDMGTASIFLALYTIVLYLASGKKRPLALSAGIFLLAALLGYEFVGIIHQRLDAWIHLWENAGSSGYQIVQSLLAIANGGAEGRGPGLGYPGLVPIAHSDFIYAAIVEETGLAGGLALLAAFALLVGRGLSAALRAKTRFQRLLGAGISAYLGVQSLLIISGNLHLLPLTGVTLPFVSYGGSSLLTSFLSLLILLIISQDNGERAAPASPQPYLLLGGVLGGWVLVAALLTGWWSLVRGPSLLLRGDNPRRAITEQYVRRGALFSREDSPLDISEMENGKYVRRYVYPPLSPVLGYTNPVYGQGGLEAALDAYLRGLQGNPAREIWWHHLLYGAPPEGVDVRLSLSLDIQRRADEALGDHIGAIVLLNAENGEILAMASHPFYDPAHLDDSLLHASDSPLLNRAALGSYPSGALLFQMLPWITDIHPVLRMDAADIHISGENLFVSPLHVALAASALSNGGIVPPARIVLAVRPPGQPWIPLPPESEEEKAASEAEISARLRALVPQENLFWSFHAVVRDESEGHPVTWHLAGTTESWTGTPLTLVILLEEDNPALAASIEREIFYAVENSP